MAKSEEAQRLNQRIRAEADKAGMAPDRLRKHVAFQRMLARFARDNAWVLKGGFSLEMRLGLAARATKDLDLWRLSPPLRFDLDVQDLVESALESDLADGFTFRVGNARHVAAQDAEASTWRVSVEAYFASSLFTSTYIDIVTTDRTDLADTDRLTIQPIVVGEAFVIRGVDLNRHAAEKYHAMARIYANDRPSSRVKDLVDLVLLIEGDWLTPALLGDALARVFAERNGTQPSSHMPELPPTDWAPTYARLAAETGASLTTIRGAWALITNYYEVAVGREDGNQ